MNTYYDHLRHQIAAVIEHLALSLVEVLGWS